MPVKEASSTETPYGRYITSEGWFVLNLAEALAVNNEEKGGRRNRSSRGNTRSAIWAPVSEVAARYGASAAKDTDKPDEAYADWPGEFEPVRLPWPLD